MQIVEAAVIEFAKRYGMDKAIEYFGLDKQTENPKYAISIGNMTLDPVNMAKRAAVNTGIKSIFSGNLGSVVGPAGLMGGAFLYAQRYNPLNPKAVNYNPTLSRQIEYAKNRNLITTNQGTGLMQYGPNSVLSGQNVVSAFGTNDYLGQLEKKQDYFEDRISKGKSISEKNYAATLNEISEAKGFNQDKGTVDYGPHGGSTQSNNGGSGDNKDDGGEGGYGGFCFDPNTLVQMANGIEKKIKDIQLGDQTKGGEVTGVFQFKASDEIHNYKGVTVAGSHYVKEDGKFIMVQDSPISVKIDKIPVVYSLDTTSRRIFIKDIEFADYNGDGVAKGFLANAGINVPEFNKEVLRQVEQRLI